MPIRTPSATLQKIIKPVSIVHKNGEVSVDVDTDEIRLRTRALDHSAYLDYSLPLPAKEDPFDGMTGSFWLEVESIEDFSKTVRDEPVVVTMPFEKTAAKMILRSNNLRYRFSPYESNHPDRLYEPPESEIVAEFSIRHGEFARSVQAANYVGSHMRVEVDPDIPRVEFLAKARGDAFVYSPPLERIDDDTGSVSSLTTMIDTLRDLSFIPDSNLVSIQLTPNFLIYQVKFPKPVGELTLYIAQHGDALSG